MFLFNNAIRANSKIIRGVQYVVFSYYDGGESIYDRVGRMIEDYFEQTEADGNYEAVFSE